MENTRFEQPAEERLTPETAPKLSYREYRNPGGDLIPLFYCSSLEAAEDGGLQLLQALEHCKQQVVGVDCIRLVDGAGKSGAAIASMQFAVLGPKGCIIIIHPFLFSAKDNDSAGLPRSIITIFSSSEILKVGHGALEIGDSIHECFGIEGHAFFELGLTHSRIQEKTLLAHGYHDTNAQAQSIGTSQTMAWGGVDELIFSYLAKRLDRDMRKVPSHTIPMTEEMMEYAASRALCGSLLYEAMVAHQELPSMAGPNSTDPLRCLVAGLPVHSENVHVPSVEEIAQQARRKVEQKKRERGRKDRKHQAEYDELNSDSKDLYKSLLELRDNIHRSTGLPLHKVSDTTNVYLLAWKKPITIDDLKDIKMKVKATQGQFAYNFVNGVRLHLGLEVLVEPLEYRRECQEERDARTQTNRPGDEAPLVEKVTTVGFWTPSLVCWGDAVMQTTILL